MSLERDVERGRQAEAALSNEAYQDAYTQVEQELTRRWRESRDRDEREQLHQFLAMLDKVRRTLEATMKSGEVATAEIVRRQSAAERLIGRMRG